MESTAARLAAMTLEELLSTDPLQTENEKLNELFRTQFAQGQAHKSADPLINVAYEKVAALVAAVRTSNPELMRALSRTDLDTEEGIVSAAEILNVDVNSMRQYYQLVLERLAKMKESDTGAAINTHIDKLKTLWSQLQRDAPIVTLTATDFPLVRTNKEGPMIVFFSGDYCMPCHMRKPSYALLAKFFTDSTLGFCTDIPRDKVNVEYVPHLILFTPEGGKIHAHLPNTTKDLWELLHRLVVLGSNIVEELMIHPENGTLIPYERMGR
jgi:hypothetical protein